MRFIGIAQYILARRFFLDAGQSFSPRQLVEHLLRSQIELCEHDQRMKPQVSTFIQHLGLTRGVSDAVNIPVIASGGVGGLQDLADGIKLGRADAVLAASIFHYGQHTVQEAKRFMSGQGIPMRLA